MKKLRKNGDMVRSWPISRVLLGICVPMTVIPLGVRLLARSSNLPGSYASRVNASLLGLAPDGGHRVSPAAAQLALGCDSSLWPCSSPHGVRPLAGILLCGARTFLYTYENTYSDCLASFTNKLYHLTKACMLTKGKLRGRPLCATLPGLQYSNKKCLKAFAT